MAMRYVGIDVAKRTLEVCVLPNDAERQFANDRPGRTSCCRWLGAPQDTLVVLEATGGYEVQAAEQLRAAGFAVAIVNPRRIRDFARACGRLAKTDRIDAQVIAQYAQTLQPPPREGLDESHRRLQALVARRDQLLAMRIAETNRMEHATDRLIRTSLRQIVRALERQLDQIEVQIRRTVEAMPSLRQTKETLMSVPGVGETTASMLVSDVPELGRLNRRQIAALVGLAPWNRDSGVFRGKRMTGGGRVRVRTRLYMPTLVAIRHNPVIRAFYERLLQNGKAKMTALVACMRKLLTLLNTLVAKNEKWKPKMV
jgi:transposase